MHHALPKAEMHVHIALALSVEIFLRRIQKRRTDIQADFLISREKRYYETLARFHATYEGMRHITATDHELAQATQIYLERIAKEGAIYAEISNSFRGDPDQYDRQVAAITEGIKAANANTGIHARIVTTAIRDRRMGPDMAEQAARHLAKTRPAYVTAFGLAGEEDIDAITDYSRAMLIAWHEAGLGLAPHVAEQYLHNAVDFFHAVPAEALEPRPTGDDRRLRVGHGTLIHQSSRLMQMFTERAICMEVCLSANKRISLPLGGRIHEVGETISGRSSQDTVVLDRNRRHYFNDIARHPLPDFIAAGIPVCLGSDNPLLMNTNIGKEYSLAVKTGVEDMRVVLNLTRNAVSYANVPADLRAQLMGYVDRYERVLIKGERVDTTAQGYRYAFNRF